MKNRLTRRFAALAVLPVLALTLAGCGDGKGGAEQSADVAVSGDAAADEVVVAITAEPEGGFDSTAGWGHGTTPLIQSTLVEYTQDMRIVNDLATDWEVSEDGITWTFDMRDDAYFTDGEPVLASDVVFTFKQAQESQSSLDLSYMVDVEANGEHEVVFTMDAPNSPFINTVAAIGIVPEHAYDQDYANHPIGSGPWKMVEWKKGEQVILERNDDYYGDLPNLKKATILFMEEDAAFTAAKAGQVNVALSSPTHATQEIDGMRIEAVSTLDNRGITLPLSPDEGKTTEDGYPIGNDVTSSQAVRHAIAYGVNRERLAEDAVNGYATPAYSEDDGLPWNNPEVVIEEDVEYAKQLLDEDGWVEKDGVREKDGVEAEFTVYYPSGDSARQALGMATAQQLEELGIRMNVEGKSWEEIQKLMFANPILMGWGSTNPYTSYLLYHSDNSLKDDYYNPEGLSDPIIDAYLEAALHAQTQEEADEQWKLAQWDGETGTSMRGVAPWVWLLNLDHIYYVDDGLDIGDQQLHGHGASWTLLQNLSHWSWN